MSELLILYSTSACHLCEQAQRLIYETLGSAVAECDISADEGLLARYGVRIPVLRRLDTGMEISWPFGPREIKDLVNQSAFSSD